MLYYDRIDVSKGTDVNKITASEKCNICHYWYFLNYCFKFQPIVCNRCHNLLLICINLSNIAILNIRSSDYHCITSLISKCNADLTEKVENYGFKKYKKFWKHIEKW